MLGTVAASVGGAVGIVAISSAILTSKATMEVVSLDYGADYVAYEISVSDLDDGIDYYLKISNAYSTYILDFLIY